MDSYRRYSDQLRLLLVTVSVALMLVTIIACERPNQPSVSASVAVGAASTATQILDPLAATKQAFDDLYETRLDQMRTAAVLSHVPTHVPGPPPTDTPGPSPTWEMGIFRSCSSGGRGFGYIDCWRGTSNGEIVSVVAGGLPIYAEGGKGSAPTGHAKAALMVGRGPYMPHAQIIVGSPDNAVFYYVPLDAELVGILSANGARLTLAVDNAQHTPTAATIIFDVATRQFISASGTPIPTTPVPTPAP
jgi:hypothetical protein